MSGKSSLALYRDTNFRKEKRVIAWLGAGMWKLKGFKKTADKGNAREKAARQTLLKCLEKSNWRKIDR